MDIVERLRNTPTNGMKPTLLDFAADEIERLRLALADLGVTPADARAGAERSKANQKDAERYRWLRDRKGCPFAETDDDAWDNLDKAMDAAMAQTHNAGSNGPSGDSREGPR